MAILVSKPLYLNLLSSISSVVVSSSVFVLFSVSDAILSGSTSSGIALFGSTLSGSDFSCMLSVFGGVDSPWSFSSAFSFTTVTFSANTVRFSVFSTGVPPEGFITGTTRVEGRSSSTGAFSSTTSGFSSATAGFSSATAGCSSTTTGGSSTTAGCSSTTAGCSSTTKVFSPSSAEITSSSCSSSSSTVGKPSCSNGLSSSITTVSNWAKGLLMISFITLSGVNVTLSWPSITTRSPVFTFTLARSFTACSLKVPKPFIFTTRSLSRPALITSTICCRNLSASAPFSLWREANIFAMSFTVAIVLICFYSLF